MERFYPKEVDVHTLSPLALAFVGDGVYSLLVRERLLTQANRPVGERTAWRCRLCVPRRRLPRCSGCSRC